ncbi:MAG: hypothetical protein K2P58_12740 [Hyphomonadaceae bacterium]|nr:hypothetical protein [Hyphomonadaceae bacterium]
MKFWRFGASRADDDARRLLGAVTAAARSPALYGEDMAPDSLQGRFEVMTLHAALALYRLRDEPGLAPLAQSFTDALFSAFDAGLREDGVSDTAVPRRMRRLAGDFYGRLRAYSTALDAGDDGALAAAIGRNLFADESAAAAATFARRARGLAEGQRSLAVERLFLPDAWAGPA